MQEIKMVIKYIFEFIAICLVLYGVYREEDLINFENKCYLWIKEVYIVLRQYFRKKLNNDKNQTLRNVCLGALVIISIMVSLSVALAIGKNEENPTTTRSSSEVATTEEESEYITESDSIYLGKFKATAYCSCKECCGIWANNRPTDENQNEIIYTASGAVAKAGRTIAVDPNVIAYGTTVLINGHEYIAEDCGGTIKGNRIDVYFDNHEDACEFGLQEVEVFIKK